jgi:hypothetical protein
MTTTKVDSTSDIFMGSGGAICHAVCWRPLEYLGVRGGLAVDFYCPGCVEHLSLPMRRLPALPMAFAAGQSFMGSKRADLDRLVAPPA